MESVVCEEESLWWKGLVKRWVLLFISSVFRLSFDCLRETDKQRWLYMVAEKTGHSHCVCEIFQMITAAYARLSGIFRNRFMSNLLVYILEK